MVKLHPPGAVGRQVLVAGVNDEVKNHFTFWSDLDDMRI